MSLDATGLSRPRLAEIKADLDARFTAALGPVNTAADSVVGQIIGIAAAALDDAYEALQATYDSMYPATAEGASLDGAVSFVGLERLGAAATSGVGMCYGSESTLIPAGAIARAADNALYVSTADAVISRANAGAVEVTVNTVENGGSYQIIAGGVSVLYVADANATAAEIVAGLAALFDADAFTATASGDVLSLRSADGLSPFTLTVASKLTISRLSSPVPFIAAVLGAQALPVGSLARIDSAITGWDAVFNFAAGITGRDVETDEELRVRHAQSVRVTGAATLSAIQARVLNDVAGVEYAAVFENRSNEVDAFGLPAHSFETVVQGGSTADIAAKVYEVKPAGIETYGNVTSSVTDENGDAQTVKFSRATAQYAWVRVTIDALDLEEALDPGYVASITAAVLATGQALGIGKDVIVQRFIGPIYAATPGLGMITVEVDTTAGPLDVPTYASANIPIARTERATFDALRVSVVVV